MNKGRIAAVILLFLCSVYQSFAQYSPFNVPDSSEIRKELVNSWFTRDYSELLAEKPFISQNLLGEKFQVSIEDAGNEFAVIVAPASEIALEVHTDDRIEMGTSDIFSYDSPGSWILYRNKEDGKPERIQYFFQSDADVYITIRPDGSKSLADIHLFNTYPVYGVNLGFPLEYFYTASFDKLYKLTSNLLPWNYFTLEEGMYGANLQMIGVIRENLGGLSYEPDTALDHEGLPVSISSGERKNPENNDTLNVDTAGFAKWVVDGLVYAQTGSFLNLDPLKRESVQIQTGTMAQSVLEKYNIYFALDWIRNLAAAFASVFSGRDIPYEKTGSEVTIKPFAAVQTDRGVERYDAYISGTGYNTITLKSLMYVLAVTEPARMYLGAVRQSDRKSPEVVYYNEVAVFFPFFDDEGAFHCIVYEGPRELTIEEFTKEWENSFISLVRLKTSKRFFPQQK